jgi:Na+-driven multidrug efflux pump
MILIAPQETEYCMDSLEKIVATNNKNKPDNSRELQNKDIKPRQAMWELAQYSAMAMPNYSTSLFFLALGTMAGHLSSNNAKNNIYVAAVPLITSYGTLFMMFSFAGFYPFGMEISDNFGKKNKVLEALKCFDIETGNRVEKAALQAQLEDINKVMSRSFWNSTVTNLPYLPLGFAGLYFSEDILVNILYQDKEVSEAAGVFLKAFSWIIPCMALRMGFDQILLPLRKQNVVMKCALISAALGFSLYYLLAYNTTLKMAGLAYGIVSDSQFIAVLFALYTQYSPDLKDFSFLRFHSFNQEDREQMVRCFYKGLPIFLTLLSETLGTTVIATFAGWLGKNQLAAQCLSTTFSGLANFLMLGIGQVVNQFVASSIGSDKYYDAVTYAKAGPFLGLITASILFSPFMFSPSLISSVVSQRLNADVINMAATPTRITLTGMILDITRYILLNALRGANCHGWSTFASIATQWLGVAIAYGLAFNGKLGLNGLAIGPVIGLSLGIGFLLYMSKNVFSLNNLKQINNFQSQLNVNENKKEILTTKTSDNRFSFHRASSFDTARVLPVNYNTDVPTIVRRNSF